MLNYEVCKNWRFDEQLVSYCSHETILYALGLGLGSNPTDPSHLRFVYENGLQAVPTLATVLGSAGLWMRDKATGIDVTKLVHGEQHLQLLAPLPASGTLRVRQAVESVVDKGIGKGALLVTRKELMDEGGASTFAVGRSVVFLRADGGFSEASGVTDEPLSSLPRAPSEPCHVQVTYETLPQAALLYRLSGDLNPLHVDPQTATKAGFEQPILHGLCTFGMAGRAALECLAEHRAEGLSSINARFTAPVWPGEAICFQFWRGDSNRFHMRAVVEARGAVVLDQGIVEVRPSV